MKKLIQPLVAAALLSFAAPSPTAAPTAIPTGMPTPATAAPTRVPTPPPTAPTSAPSMTSLRVFAPPCTGRNTVSLNYMNEWTELRSNPTSLTYGVDATCEWVVRGPSGSDIELAFATFATECSFDYVFIMDGDADDAPVIFAGSGTTLPAASVTAFSGTARVVFYSDLNYVLSGFVITATAVPDCGSGGTCGGNGACNATTGRCVCTTGSLGPYCGVDACPSGCNTGGGQGACVDNTHCVCASGFVGRDCGTTASSVSNVWTTVGYNNAVTADDGASVVPRAGHTATVVGDSVVVYGGVSLAHTAPPATLTRLSLTTLTWSMDAPVAVTMAPRFWHTTVLDTSANRLLVFGGYVGNATTDSNLPLWTNVRYNQTNQLWSIAADAVGAAVAGATQLETPSTSTLPPPLAEHTATVVDNTMIVLGGRTTMGFLSGVWELTLSPSLTWSHHTPSGEAVLMAGHSAAYHAATGRIFTFGGYGPGRSGVDERSNVLRVYNPTLREWRTLVPSGVNLVPPLAQHTATMLGDTMVVYGGNLHTNTVQTCYSSETYLYRIGCNQWSRLAPLAGLTYVDGSAGRLGHQAVVNGTTNTVVVLGGFSGTLRADVLALSLDPSTVCNVSSWEAGITTTTTANNASGSNSGSAATTSTSSTVAACVETAMCGTCAALTTCADCTALPNCSWSTAGLLCQYNPTASSTTTTATTTMSIIDTCGGSTSGFLSMRWFPASRYGTGQPPQVSNTVLSLATRRGLQASMVEVVQGMVAVPAGPVIVTVTAARGSEASLSINHVNTIVTVTGTTNSAVLGTFAQPTNVTLSLTVSTTAGGNHQASVTWTTVPPSLGYNNTQINATHALPRGYDTCAGYSDCAGCAADVRCVWNLTHAATSNAVGPTCVPASSSGSGEDVLAVLPEACVRCDDYPDCGSCLDGSPLVCEWAPVNEPTRTYGCRPRTSTSTITSAAPTTPPPAASTTLSMSTSTMSQTPATTTTLSPTTALVVRSRDACPLPCAARTTCGTCVDTTAPQTTVCAWCSGTSSCLDLGSYDDQQIFGHCPAWYTGSCPNCSALPSCSACLAQPGCGWCGDASVSGGTDTDPINGTCYSGNATTYTLGNGTVLDTSATCPGTVGGQWEFDTCAATNHGQCSANVSEHVLQCGANASCVNTTFGLACICDTGYEAQNSALVPSVTNPCVPSCSACVHGTCLSPGVCACHLGYFGSDCSLDCGCNGHGLCPINATVGGGVCLLCDASTTGPTCNQCARGYYGTATDGGVCSPCNCSGHGNVSMGVCDGVTGSCFCSDYTAGNNCEVCIPGFVRDGNNCFIGCQFELAHPHEDRASVRHRLTEPSGGIWTRPMQTTDVTTSCQWFIDAGDPNATITLTLSDLNTECFYDYIHVFDDEIPSPASMLAVYSGVNAPSLPLVSTTGKMVIQFRTDENYVIEGQRALQAVYTVAPCPGSNATTNCSGHGTCTNGGVCSCASGYFGRDCALQNCTLDCSTSGCVGVDHGHCVCDTGLTGPNCTETIESDAWFPMNAPLVPDSADHSGLMGHTSVYSVTSDTSWTFGGFNLRQYSNMLLQRNFSSGTTTVFTQPAGTVTWPQAMYMHSAVLTTLQGSDMMIVFGGSNGESQYLDGLWYANLTIPSNPTWTDMTHATIGDQPPGVIGHSATVYNGVMYVFGGITLEYGLQAAVYSFTMASTTWSRIAAAGAPPTGLFGHTSVLINDSIWLYGGSREMPIPLNRYTEVIKSSYISSFDPRTHTFTPVMPLTNCAEAAADCMGRRLHTTTLVDNRYLLVFGGCPFYHGFAGLLGANFSCFTNALHVLDLACATELGWITSHSFGVSRHAPAVRSGHSAIYRPAARQLVVMGGFGGTALNDVVEFAVPLQFCSRHNTQRSCIADPSNCAWNTTSSVCADTNATGPDMVRRNNSTPDCRTQEQSCTAFVRTEAEWFNSFQYGFAGVTPPCDPCRRNPFCSGCLARPPSTRSNLVCSDVNATQCAPNGTLLASTAPGAAAAPICTAPCAAFSGSCADCNVTDGCVYNASLQLGLCLDASSATSPPLADDSTCSLADNMLCIERQNRSECVAGPGCHWCESSSTCHDGLGVMTEYSFGQCYEYVGYPDQYDCAAETTCSSCVASARCGWCDGGNGTGVCAEGDPSGPSTLSTCPSLASDWHWWVCPPAVGAQSNPCLLPNGSNVCGPNSTCTPLYATAVYTDSYRCTCGQGYNLSADGTTCLPVCSAADCVHGRCSAPGTCECDVGWFGTRCDHDCLCNDHSTCGLGPGQCDTCTQGTEGLFCQDCQNGYYGNGTRSAPPYAGQCAPCINACNGRSSACKSSPAQPGPVCSNCDDHSYGEYCHQCRTGYFIDPAIQAAAFVAFPDNHGRPWSRQGRNVVNTTVLHVVEEYLLANLSANLTCVPCMCNGHSNVCDSVTGENCECGDNTKTNFVSQNDGSLCSAEVARHGSCYNIQCAECDAFGRIDGNLWPLQFNTSTGPTNGKRCYVNIDEMQIFHGTISNFSVMPFALKMRWTNVDLRIYIRASHPAMVNAYVVRNADTNFSQGLAAMPAWKVLGSVTPLSGHVSEVVADYHDTDGSFVYVILESLGNTTTQFEIFFSQPQVRNLHLFIFFTSFFCCFYLVVFVLFSVLAIRANAVGRQREEQEAVELENLSSRPSATARLLMPSCTLSHAQARVVVDLQATGRLAFTPLSYQPHHSNRAAVASFLLEFPSSAEHRRFALGVGLVAMSEGKDGTTRLSDAADEPDVMQSGWSTENNTLASASICRNGINEARL
eukprot:m.112060 g.112060  ORF g.112060 m.112060 type:complete len:2775 (+) comp10770_c1_seq4:62-8386(+)